MQLVLLMVVITCGMIDVTRMTSLGAELHEDTTNILNRLLNGSDSRLRPLYGGLPTVVNTDINVRSMGPISEVDMSYSMDAYFRQRWKDERLRFNWSQDTNGTLKEMRVHIKVLEHIWKPDTFFFNGQGSYLHDATVPNKLLRIKETGDILYSMRLTIKARCPMHLEYFPMDQQSCPLVIGSFAYRSDQIVYRWTEGPADSIKIAQDVRLSQYDLIGQHADERFVTKNNTERFSVLTVNFTLQRHMGYYLLQVYLPCNMIVVISWLSFWIPRETTADRVGLGVTAVLTLTTLGMDARSDLPKVPYATALDVYLIMCYLFVVATLIEFAAVHYFTKRNFGDFADDSMTHEGRPAAAAAAVDDTDVDDCTGGRNDDRDMLSQYTANTTGIGDHCLDLGLDHSTSAFHSLDNNCMKMEYSEMLCVNRKQPFTYQGNDQNGAMRTKYTEKVNGGQDRKGHGQSHGRYSCFRKLLFCLIGSTSYQNTVRQAAGSGMNSVSMIDQVSRILFPFTYVTLNVLYWLSYLRKLGF